MKLLSVIPIEPAFCLEFHFIIGTKKKKTKKSSKKWFRSGWLNLFIQARAADTDQFTKMRLQHHKQFPILTK